MPSVEGGGIGRVHRVHEISDREHAERLVRGALHTSKTADTSKASRHNPAPTRGPPVNSNATDPIPQRDATAASASLLDGALQAIDRAEAGNQTGHVERGRQYATAAETARHHAADGSPELAAAHWTVADTLVGPLDTADADQLRDFIAGAVNWDERRLSYILDRAEIAAEVDRRAAVSEA